MKYHFLLKGKQEFMKCEIENQQEIENSKNIDCINPTIAILQEELK